MTTPATLVAPTDLPRTDVVPPALVDPPDLPRRAFVAQVMGLPFSVHVRGPRARSAEVAAAVGAMFDRLRADDARFSPYRPDSEVSRIRRGELTVAAASARLRRVAALCDEATERTHGAFSAWLPLSAGGGATTFDPTGLVKGWAAQEATDRLLEDLDRLTPSTPATAHDVLVSAGGDVGVTCRRTDTPDWEVGVEDPTDRDRLMATLSLRTGAVATSGSAARGHHVVDPRSGSPATELRSATVAGPSLLWADVYATALLASGGEGSWLPTAPAHLALVVGLDGSVTRVAQR